MKNQKRNTRKDYAREYARKYREKNREKIHAAAVASKSTPEGRAKWKANKAYDNAVKRVRRFGGQIASSKEERKAMRNLYHSVKLANLYNPHMERLEVDHKVCIADGGSHTLENLQVLRRGENMRKKPQGLRSHINPVLPPKGSSGRRQRSGGKDAAGLPPAGTDGV